jgi:hypothetical protein
MIMSMQQDLPTLASTADRTVATRTLASSRAEIMTICHGQSADFWLFDVFVIRVLSQ